MKKIQLTLLFLITSLISFSQCDNKLFQDNISRVFIFRDTVDVLRVPENEIISPMRDSIILLQRGLDEMRKKLYKDDLISFYALTNMIANITVNDSKWCVEWYYEELRVYLLMYYKKF